MTLTRRTGRTGRTCSTWLFAAMLVACAAPAQAQITPRTPRPDWAVFGSGVSNTGQKLVLTANFGGGYEDDLTKLPANQPPAPEGTQPAYSGPFGTAGATLSYTVDKEGIRGGVSFGVNGRNYRQQEDQPFIGTYSLSSNVGWDVSKHGTLSAAFWAGQYVQNLAPSYGGGAMGGPSYPGVPSMPSDPGVYGTGDTYKGLGSNVSYDHKITKRISGYGGWSYYRNDAWNEVDTAGTYDSQFLNAGVRYAIGKGFSARAGYGRTLSGFGSDDNNQYRGGTLDFGVDYSGSLSPTRRSTLTFGTGVSGIRDLTGTTHYYATGNVNYSYEIGRSWTAGIGASRSTDFYQTLGQPAVTDSVSGSLNGLIGRKLSVWLSGGWYRGTYAGASASAYDSVSASAGASYALSRMFSLSADYYYYQYDYAEDALLPPGYDQTMKRQTIRGTLNVFLPLWTQARRPSATR